MQDPSNSPPLSWWHSLMYSTGILLLVCGIPASICLPFVFMREGHLARSDALLLGLCLIGAEALLAGTLLFVAGQVTKHLKRNQAP